MSQIGEFLIALGVLLGSILGVLSAYGLIRLPDVYTRSHAATKSATLGVLLILLGAFLYFTFYLEYVSAKLLLGIFFVFITGPLAGHLNGRAAYRSGVSLWEKSVRDELKPELKRERERQEQEQAQARAEASGKA
ncbi:monovalent cation/H(+) antiporter subunit G [Paenibacillus sp. JCM 10914]|uniref:monovalent cation/H(+) antiporter subunit G n=1 Tax=Paenibacillus sp. JCM 10914 TaxID=1236974 RepID=UPI0003CC275C|nr:monovalent cation/H(+) antiporter subunit G [Paenibacillus sp. JCM 10914]GAE05073.1 acyl-[acyl-carrier-protein]-UDP-N-acetylglucosamine O-acyltransferase [Paenibacillus sp. JCM 10914]